MAAEDDRGRCLNGEETTTRHFDEQFAISASPPNCELANGNCIVFTADNGSCEGSSGAAVYKRLKHCKKSSSDRKCHPVTSSKVSAMGALEHQTVEELLHMPSDDTISDQNNNAFHDAAANNSCDSSNLKSHRVILDQIHQSLSDNGGVGSCIQNALARDTKTDKMKIKSGLNSLIKQDFEDVCRVASEVSVNGDDQFEINQMCKNALSSVLSSRKFTLLCKLLVENFEGTKYDRLLNFGIINARMKQGMYEHSPTLFMVDTEEVWGKLEEIGTELVSLAKSLSDVTKTSCYEHVGISSQSSGDGNYTVNVHCDAKMEQPTENFGVCRISTCKECGNMVDDREYLVCDSCETMHHLSCIQTPIGDFHSLNWYCSHCIGNGFRLSAHDNCAVCIKLNTPENVLVKKEASPSETPIICCKICGGALFTDEKLRECEHSECNNTYHERCLVGKQLEPSGPLWYCPSCLCQSCLINGDDEQIILCDGCDDSYHMYCLRPKLEKLPSNKWFCLNCKSGIQAVIEAKQACEEKRKRKKKDET